MSREAMKLALDMLNEIADDVYCDQKLEGVITALRQALETDGGNCYGDGTVYRGQRSKDSAVKTYTVKAIEAKLKEKNHE